jgi:hypothetical protein
MITVGFSRGDVAQTSDHAHDLFTQSNNAPATMNDDTPLPFDLLAVARKKMAVAFDCGRHTSDGGVLLLAQIERRLVIVERLARCIEDPRDPACVDHTLAEMIRFRALLIAAGLSGRQRL